MLAKLAGAAAVVAGCSLMGILAAKEKEDRVRELFHITTDLQLMESELQFSPCGLEFVFARAENSRFSAVLQKALQRMGKGEATCSAYLAALRETPLPLTKKDRSVLEAFGTGLGAIDTEGQLANLRLCTERVRALSTEAMHDRDKNARLYRQSGLLFGIILAILMF